MEPIRPARIGQTRLLGVTTRKCSECTTSWTKHERASRWYVCCTLDDCRSGGGRRHVSDVPIPDLMSAKSAEGWQISSLIVGPTLLEIRDQGSSRLSAGSRAASSRACRSAVAKSPVSHDRDQRHQHVPVRRMLPMRFVQARRCLSGRTGRVQRDGVNIGVARIIRGEFTGAAQQVERSRVVVLVRTERL